jgi:hypothetical protein
MTGIQVTGLEKLGNALDMYSARSSAAISDVIKLTALAIEADAIKSIQRGQKTGVIYKKGKSSHQASAAGEAPATDTGKLVKSIRSVISEKEAYVGTDYAVGRYLESGTTRTKARPWLRPARQKNIKLFLQRLKAALK